MRRPARRAFSLIEIVVAFAVLALLATPLHLLFSTGARTVLQARDLQAACAAAGSYLSALGAADPAGFAPCGPTADAGLPGPVSPAALGLPPLRDGFERTVELRPVAIDGRPYLLARVAVAWTSPASGKRLDYVAAGLVRQAAR